MSTDSGNEDSGESGQQSEKASKGKGFLGILVFLIAVGGVVLIIMSGQDPSIPQIEGYGGNQNPFVGITNVASGVFGIFETILLLLAGGALLAISLIGFAIWRNFERIKAQIVRGKLGRWTLIGAATVFVVIAFVDAIETSQENKQDSERILAANILNSERILAANILRGDNFGKWRRPHAPGPFVDYYDSGEKAVEGQYDVNKKMSGPWTQWRETGEVAGEQIYVDGLRDGTVKSWPPGHVRPDESEHRSGQQLHMLTYFADGQIKYEGKDTYGEDGKRHGSATDWYESGQVRNQSTHINGVLQGATHWHENGQQESDTFREGNILLIRRWTASGVAVPCEKPRQWVRQAFCTN